MGYNQPDQLLVESILRGNSNAFGAVIKKTEGLVAQIVFRMINNTEDRKDISQDVYLKAFHKLRDFQFQSKLSTWIAQIAYNTCLNYIERKKNILPGNLHGSNEMDETDIDISSLNISAGQTEIIIHKKELSVIIQSAMENLSPIYKTLITLYHQEEMSYYEIGQITLLPEGTVKNYLFRARKALKENILATHKREEL